MPDVGTGAIGRMISGTICRFRCTMAASPARIFAERLDSDIAARFARHTSRLDRLAHYLGLALGGRPGAGLASQLLRARDPLPRACPGWL